MTDTFERLCTLLVKHNKLMPERLTPDAPLESLDIDSLGTVEMLWNVEDAFHIKLPSEPVELTTLGDVARYIDQLLAAQIKPGPTKAVLGARLGAAGVPPDLALRAGPPEGVDHARERPVGLS